MLDVADAIIELHDAVVLSDAPEEESECPE
jgi:hypothetical protein